MENIMVMNALLVFISVILFAYTGYSVYKDAKLEKQAIEKELALINEPDPLTVERIIGDSKISICKDRNYEFRRLVKSTKNLNIYVQERWHSLDGSLNAGGVDGEIVLSKPIHYPLDAGFEKVMTFKKTIPETIGKGRWEYRPIANYMVNEKKRITRALPTQLIEVDCDFDPIKHVESK